MLIYFSVQNYRSVREKQTINLLATSLSEHRESNLNESNFGSILKSTVLYGQNASGKSKVLDAIVFYKWFIVSSATETQTGDEIDVEPFLLNDKTEEEPSYFESAFVIGGKKYRYGFECDKKVVKKEWLLEATKVKEHPLFLRIDKDYQIDEKRFKGAEDLIEKTRNNTLFLSVCSQWSVKKAESIISWFSNIYTAHGLITESYRYSTLAMMQNKKRAKIIEKFVRNVDLGIQSMDTYEFEIPEDLGDRFPKSLKNFNKNKNKKKKTETSTAVFTLHKKFDSEFKRIDDKPLILDVHESEGTKKFFNLLGFIIDTLLEDRILIIDELDARFHSLLTKTIIKIFNSKKINSNAQLIAACHDTSQIDKRILRRDQILIIDKDRFGSTEITPLSKYKPRKGEAIDKNYLSGKYGGIPIISEIEGLFDNGEKK